MEKPLVVMARLVTASRLLQSARLQRLPRARPYRRGLATSAARLEEQPVLGIRREETSIWERRAPLNPIHVQRLIRDGIKVRLALREH